MVQKVADLLGITLFECFERGYVAEYGELISADQISTIERDWRAYKRSDKVPEYMAKWVASHAQDEVPL